MAARRAGAAPTSGEADRLTRAVAYVRMSTDHQKYSTENQIEAIRRYADTRGIEIIRTYEDAGRSGQRLDGREALQRLMRDVTSGSADMSLVENCARRQHRAVDLLQEVGTLRKRGYDDTQIATKIGVTSSHLSERLVLSSRRWSPGIRIRRAPTFSLTGTCGSRR